MSMRSQVYLQPGEAISCIGCHEGRNTAPPVVGLGPMKVHDITPCPGPRYEGALSFARTVQPVLDRYCIRCHGLGKQTRKLNLLGEPSGQFSVAYESLVRRRGLISLAQRNRERAYSTERLYGAHAGKLAGLLLGKHAARARLDTDSFRRIAQWLDLNGQYYGDYSHRRAERRRGDDKGVRALRSYLEGRCGSCHETLHAEPLAALVNVALPRASRVLKAKLQKSAGGWGQCRPLWPSTNHEQYKALWEKVLAATGPGDPRPVEAAKR